MAEFKGICGWLDEHERAKPRSLGEDNSMDAKAKVVNKAKWIDSSGHEVWKPGGKP